MTVEGANNGGLLSRLNGLSLFVPVSQLEKKGHNEWWTEQVGPAAVAAARGRLLQRWAGGGSADACIQMGVVVCPAAGHGVPVFWEGGQPGCAGGGAR